MFFLLFCQCKVTSNLMSQPNFTTIRLYYQPNGSYLPINSGLGCVPSYQHLEVGNAQSLPPVPLSDTCGRLCIYM